MKFGFLAHAVDDPHRNMVRALGLLGAVVADRSGRMRPAGHLGLPMLRTIESATGARCTGEVRHLPGLAAELLGDPRAARQLVERQVRDLAASGAALVGLGGATSIVGDRGRAVADATGVPLTSGNSLTVWATGELLRTVLTALGTGLPGTEICVVGFPGAIGLATAQLILAGGGRVLLVTRRGRMRHDDLVARFLPEHRDRVGVGDDLDAALDRSRLVVSASSTGGLIDPRRLLPGTVVIDVALPRDVLDGGQRDDVLVLDGGLVTAGPRIRLDGSTTGPGDRLNGCLAETVVLALDGRAVSHSLGRELDSRVVDDLGRRALLHGFAAAAPSSRGRAVSLDRVARLAAWHRPASGSAVSAPGTAARERFATRVNPAMARLYASYGLDRVFVRGHGSTLIDADGRAHLDFVAGFGSLNLGHNHPAVTAGLRKFLDSSAPTFVQYTSVPEHTALLAERLTDLAPGQLQRVFFGNSGTEAVEAALKLARAATGRTRLVHASNSYHGKTFGALSVSGRSSYRDPFAPLLPGCTEVPYGDLAALTEALSGAAAFIVEPVQGEGGVILPPPGYLAAAQQACRDAGALFVVDEIQTGLGRTGRMFACDHEGLAPDVLCLAKSLSGGLVPISATLATAEVWDRAYGTATRALLHTSTFGGGNLASAVALATLDVLIGDDLPARAAELGERLRDGLRRVCRPYPFVREVRGLGLMTAIEFDGCFDGALQALADEFLTRLPGDLGTLAATLPDRVRTAVRGARDEVEAALSDLLCLRFVELMGRDHRMLTFTTANRDRVVRIQPPLVLTRDEADRFVTAVERTCARLQADLLA